MSSGGGIRTRDLRVMSPTSYLTAPPRVATVKCTNVARGCKWASGGRGIGEHHLLGGDLDALGLEGGVDALAQLAPHLELL